jgi:hypothetical protein
MDAVFNIDQHAKLCKSHDNPEVKVCRAAVAVGGWVGGVGTGGEAFKGVAAPDLMA